jgi:hypothetical protein
MNYIMKKMITALSAIGLIGVVSSSVVACDPVGDKARKEISDHALDKYLTNTDLGEFEFGMYDPLGNTHPEYEFADEMVQKIKELNKDNPDVVSELTTKEVIQKIDSMTFSWGDGKGSIETNNERCVVYCSIGANFDYFMDSPVPEFFYGGSKVMGSFSIEKSCIDSFLSYSFYRGQAVHWEDSNSKTSL